MLTKSTLRSATGSASARRLDEPDAAAEPPPRLGQHALAEVEAGDGARVAEHAHGLGGDEAGADRHVEEALARREAGAAQRLRAGTSRRCRARTRR